MRTLCAHGVSECEGPKTAAGDKLVHLLARRGPGRVEVQRYENIFSGALDERVELLDALDLVDLRHGGAGGAIDGAVEVMSEAGGVGCCFNFGGANF
jgi:hypothetical protein